MVLLGSAVVGAGGVLVLPSEFLRAQKIAPGDSVTLVIDHLGRLLVTPDVRLSVEKRRP